MRLRVAVVTGVVMGVGAASGVAVAYFDSSTANGGNTFAAASDFVAPNASPAALIKSEGGEGDFIRPGGGYRAYANVTDTGAPASGVGSVTADVGSGPFALTSGSFTGDGVSYNFRSAAQTAPAWAAGARTANFVLSDNASNSRTVAQGFTVDATAPVPTDIQITDGGGQAGSPQAGDVVTFGFSEPIDRESIIAGWTSGGGPRNVVVRLIDGGLGSDTVRVYDSTNTTQIAALGTVTLNSLLYTGSTRTYGVTGTPSQITRTGNNMVVTLGTGANGVGGIVPGTMTWSPSTAAFDRAGNPSTAPAVTESGALDTEF